MLVGIEWLWVVLAEAAGSCLLVQPGVGGCLDRTRQLLEPRSFALEVQTRDQHWL